ncbi:acyl-coenzyme A diphosphatase FITM2-like [Salvelinus alpinus]|uniref:Fat storage-inducing transmembrane protein 2-like n=1 Tax=Salvelinus namaycush TaxID=8040 RepID=A0A8U1EYQ5_SALNM|nr:fat storage-inducing transmembrane protein 2 [Salvelinus alpinus]XP_038866510.1 fat storage-inducing transmembrane protein 2-like [Salvelinus namaycush]
MSRCTIPIPSFIGPPSAILVPSGNMADVDIIVNKFVALWRIPFVRLKLPWIFLGLSMVGSLVKSTQLVPETYFSNSRNVLNMYFVKVSWGWTLLLLTPFIFLIHYNDSLTFALRRMSSLVVATAIWYTFTETFFYIEDATGTCHRDQVPHKEFTTKWRCRSAGGQWDGYDISGHSFILSYSALIIAEEMAPMATMERNRNIVLDLLYVSLNGIVFIWIWMFMCTSVYFHNFWQNGLGTVFGILAWFVTYRVWYPKPLSPGLPLKPTKQS